MDRRVTMADFFLLLGVVIIFLYIYIKDKYQNPKK